MMKNYLPLVMIAIIAMYGCEKENGGSTDIKNEIFFNVNEIVDSTQTGKSTVSITEYDERYRYDIWEPYAGLPETVWLGYFLNFTYNSENFGQVQGTLVFEKREFDFSKITFIDEKKWRYNDDKDFIAFLNQESNSWLSLEPTILSPLISKVTEIREIDGKNYMYVDKEFSGYAIQLYNPGNGYKITNGFMRVLIPID